MSVDSVYFSESVCQPGLVHCPLRRTKISVTPAGTYGAFSVHLYFKDIGTPDDRDITKALYLRTREFEASQFSAVFLEVRSRLEHLRLILPFLLASTDNDGVGGTSFSRVLVSLANQARQTDSRTLRSSVRSFCV